MYWKISIKIAMWYLLFGCLWILLSDWGLESVTKDPDALSRLQTFKGWFFIIVTATILLFFVKDQFYKHFKLLEKFKETEIRFKSVFDNVYQIIAVTDSEGSVLYINRAGVAFFQTTEPEIVGKPLWGLPAWDTDTPAKNKFIQAIPSAVAGELIRFGTGLTRSHGDVHYLDFSVKPAIGEDDRVIFLIVEGRDITEHKKSESRLEKYEHMVSSSRDMMCLVDQHHIYQEVNAVFTEYFNKSRSEIIGSGMSDVVGREMFENNIRPFANLCLKGREVNRQEWMTIHTGENRLLDTSYFPHYEKNREGEVVGYVVIARDITRTRQLEDQLMQASKLEAIGTLAGGIAHDFNNILAAIMGYAEVTKDLLQPGTQAWENVEGIRKAGRRAADLVKQILSFSRQTDQKVMPVRMGPIVREALKLIRASLPASIEISSDIRSNTMVESNTTQLHQIVMNLCANAGYAMEENGGVLTASLQDVEVDPEQVERHLGLLPGRYVRLTVADTGCGMTPEVQRRIFDPFFTTKPKGVGTGMGLSQVHGIVTSGRGCIKVYSEPEKGTTFHVYLPAAESDVQGVAKDAEAIIPVGSESILFVDDEAFLVQLGKSMLERLGYAVAAISGSVEALKLFDENPSRFDLVITDYAMPNMTGDKLALEILKRRPGMPIILVTGFGDRFTEDSVRKLGIRKLILKPILKKDMAVAIREALTTETP